MRSEKEVRDKLEQQRRGRDKYLEEWRATGGSSMDAGIQQYAATIRILEWILNEDAFVLRAECARSPLSE